MVPGREKDHAGQVRAAAGCGLAAPQPGSLDALMAASHDGPFAPDDASTVGAVPQQRYGAYYSEVSPLDAHDAVVHLPHVTPADADESALAFAPRDVQDAFSRWKPE